MAKYSVSVLFEGQGRLIVRADTEDQAVEGAQQMDLEDIDVALFSIRATDIKRRLTTGDDIHERAEE